MTSLSQPHELGYIYYVEPSYISYGSHDPVPSILQLFNLRLNLDHLPFSFHPGSFDGTCFLSLCGLLSFFTSQFPIPNFSNSYLLDLHDMTLRNLILVVF